MLFAELTDKFSIFIESLSGVVWGFATFGVTNALKGAILLFFLNLKLFSVYLLFGIGDLHLKCVHFLRLGIDEMLFIED